MPTSNERKMLSSNEALKELMVIKPNPSTHGDMGWGGAALYRWHPKIMSRSCQGHLKVTARSNQPKREKG